jgi:hypothetical protein
MKTRTLAALLLLCSSCTHNLNIEKFPAHIDADVHSDVALSVTVPNQSDSPLTVENLNIWMAKKATLQVDVAQMNRNARDFIAEYLHSKGVETESPDKSLHFEITKVQYETWGNPLFLIIQGCYLHFNVETSSGYVQQYKVQDQSGWNLDRAVSGAVSRAVERMFEDPEIIAFINN